MSKAKRFFAILFTLSLLSFSSLAQAQAQTKPWSDGCVYGDVATIQGVECLARNFLNVAIPILGVVILVVIILGAYKILTSGGDPKAVEAGKNTITYAVLGLIVAISGWFIINFISTFTGVQNIKEFNTQIDAISTNPPAPDNR
jgi:hypothetical protein